MDRLLKRLHLLPWRNDLSVRKVTLRNLPLISGARDGEPEFYSPNFVLGTGIQKPIPARLVEVESEATYASFPWRSIYLRAIEAMLHCRFEISTHESCTVRSKHPRLDFRSRKVRGENQFLDFPTPLNHNVFEKGSGMIYSILLTSSFELY